MTPATTFADRRVALFGLGGSGMATALALRAGGADLLACDDDPGRMAEAAGRGIRTGDLRGADWAGFDAFVLSPGVPLTHPAPHWTVDLARAAGVEIIGDIEIFCRERAALAPDAPFVAITGTNGKSTTTALISHILREAGRDVQMGGNIGTPILALQPPARTRVHVVEMSSFQIDLTPGANPTIAVLLNVTPDHIDRHGSLEAYAAIKRRLALSADVAVMGVCDEHTLPVWNDRVGDRPRIRFGDLYVAAGWVMAPEGVIARLDGISSLRGAHNAQNALAAIATALELGVPTALLAGALRTFPGLPHRMEEVGRVGRALVVNDSKATNADSTEKALSSFDRIFWILGGKAKEGGIDPLKPFFTKIEKAYLIGEAAEVFAQALDGAVPFERSGTLERAVARAAEDAQASNAPEPVVLLSPACASYDQFRNFEERGDCFRRLVQALPGFAGRGGGLGP